MIWYRGGSILVFSLAVFYGPQALAETAAFVVMVMNFGGLTPFRRSRFVGLDIDCVLVLLSLEFRSILQFPCSHFDFSAESL